MSFTVDLYKLYSQTVLNYRNWWRSKGTSHTKLTSKL